MSVDPVEQRKNRIIILGGMGLLLAVLVGVFIYLQQGDDEGQSAAETSSTPTAESTPSEDEDTSEGEDGSEDAPADDRGDLPGQDEIEKASKDSEQARKVAGQVIDRMAKTDQSTTKWRKTLTPLFTEQGQTQVDSLTPDSVEFSQRSGEPSLVLSGGRAEGQFPIAVDTDEGMWLVLMVEDDDKWRALSVSEYDTGQEPEGTNA